MKFISLQEYFKNEFVWFVLFCPCLHLYQLVREWILHPWSNLSGCSFKGSPSKLAPFHTLASLQLLASNHDIHTDSSQPSFPVMCSASFPIRKQPTWGFTSRKCTSQLRAVICFFKFQLIVKIYIILGLEIILNNI